MISIDENEDEIRIPELRVKSLQDGYKIHFGGWELDLVETDFGRLLIELFKKQTNDSVVSKKIYIDQNLFVEF